MQDPKSQLVHLVCGSTGAGKTTFSRKLANDLGGVVFSIDEWMVTLFGEDAPESLDPSWIFPRVARCEAQIWKMVLHLGMLGIPSVLDFGFQRHAHRQRYAHLAKQAEFTVKLHVLNAAPSERWMRIEARNKAQGESYHMDITRDMFDYIETTWEPPKSDELSPL